MKKISLIAVLTALFAGLALANGTTGTASAGDLPIYRAANEYRDAVLDFEREVFRSRHFGRDAKRIADDLEDASGRLRTAARRCDDVNRLLNEWNGIVCLMPRVEAVVFSGPRCVDTEVLEFRWAHVRRTAELVARHIAAYQPVVVGRPPIYGHGPQFGNGYGYGQGRSRGGFDDPFFDPRPFPSTVPPVVVPQVRQPVLYHSPAFPPPVNRSGIHPDRRSFDARDNRVDVSRLVIGLMDSAMRSREPVTRLQRDIAPSSLRAVRAPVGNTQVGARLQRRID